MISFNFRIPTQELLGTYIQNCSWELRNYILCTYKKLKTIKKRRPLKLKHTYCTCKKKQDQGIFYENTAQKVSKYHQYRGQKSQSLGTILGGGRRSSFYSTDVELVTFFLQDEGSSLTDSKFLKFKIFIWANISFVRTDRQTNRQTDKPTTYQILFGLVKTSRSAGQGRASRQ